MILEEGSYLVTETLAPGSKASGISCSPGPHCSNADLDTRSVQAGVVGGTITHVSYTNSTTLGTLRVCKSAGPGAEPGTNFDFTALNTSGKVVPVNLTLPADDCGEVTLEEGDYELSEQAMPLVKLSGMSCGPGHLCGQLDLANRTMMLTIVGNQIVFAVAADDCSDIALEEGGYELFENAVDEVRVSGIGCTPSHLCGDIDLPTSSLELTIVDNQTTTASFTNRSTRGTLRIRKVAGPGVTAGTIYKFGAIKSDHALFIDVPADDCSDAKIPAGEYAFSEIIPAGVQVADIGCTPLLACFNVSVPDGTATVHVATDLLTTVTVTNQAVVSGGPDDRP